MERLSTYVALAGGGLEGWARGGARWSLDLFRVGEKGDYDSPEYINTKNHNACHIESIQDRNFDMTHTQNSIFIDETSLFLF